MDHNIPLCIVEQRNQILVASLIVLLDLEQILIALIVGSFRWNQAHIHIHIPDIKVCLLFVGLLVVT